MHLGDQTQVFTLGKHFPDYLSNPDFLLFSQEMVCSLGILGKGVLNVVTFYYKDNFTGFWPAFSEFLFLPVTF